jgi:hypothetical protein
MSILLGIGADFPLMARSNLPEFVTFRAIETRKYRLIVITDQLGFQLERSRVRGPNGTITSRTSFTLERAQITTASSRGTSPA